MVSTTLQHRRRKCLPHYHALLFKSSQREWFPPGLYTDPFRCKMRTTQGDRDARQERREYGGRCASRRAWWMGSATFTERGANAARRRGERKLGAVQAVLEAGVRFDCQHAPAEPEPEECLLLSCLAPLRNVDVPILRTSVRTYCDARRGGAPLRVCSKRRPGLICPIWGKPSHCQ